MSKIALILLGLLATSMSTSFAGSADVAIEAFQADKAVQVKLGDPNTNGCKYKEPQTVVTMSNDVMSLGDNFLVIQEVHCLQADFAVAAKLNVYSELHRQPDNSFRVVYRPRNLSLIDLGVPRN